MNILWRLVFLQAGKQPAEDVGGSAPWVESPRGNNYLPRRLHQTDFGPADSRNEEKKLPYGNDSIIQLWDFDFNHK